METEQLSPLGPERCLRRAGTHRRDVFQAFQRCLLYSCVQGIKMPNGLNDMKGQPHTCSGGGFLNDTLSRECGQPWPPFPFMSLLEVCQELFCELQKQEELLFQQERK